MKKAIVGLIGLVMIFFGLDMGMNLAHKAFLVRAYTGDCTIALHRLGVFMYDLVNHTDESGTAFELRPEHTVTDLIQEIVNRGNLPPEDVCCRYGDGLPYLVFPEPASVLLTKYGPHDQVPIVMDPPDAHDESRLTMFICRLFHMHSTDYAFTARVLYANGTIGTLSREEAEKLVAERSPVPINLDFEAKTEAKSE